MGNHTIGAAFVACATIAAERRLPDETATDILDLAAERSGVRGMDAEFDDATQFGEPFCKLIIEAFGNPAEFSDEYDDDDTAEEAYDRFYEGPYAVFRKRYDLC